MRLTRRPATWLLAGAFVVLLPTLAILQYQWIGQVNDAARERLQRNLENAAGQFRLEFDRELARAFLSLQVSEATAAGVPRAVDRYAERYATWARTALHPALVANIYLVRLNPGQDGGSEPDAALLRWAPERSAFDEVPWEGTPLARWRGRIARLLSGADMDRGEVIELEDRLLAGPLRVFDDLPALAEGLTVLDLDLDYVRTDWLPELAERHFVQRGEDGYRVAVVSNQGPREVLYRTDADAPLIDTQADVLETLFSVEVPDLYAGETVGGGVLSDLPIGVSGLGWNLLATHRSGSLDSAVAAARVRSLGISFGVLVLLAGSVGLLVVTSRREQELARQQMEFVAGVSHELRTPVSVIQAAAANLSGGVVTGERVRQYGATISDQARRLGSMVEQALQFARAQSRTSLHGLPPVSPAQLVEEALAAARPLLPASAAVDLECLTGVPDVRGDAEDLRTAVLNLITNAAKYGGADGWIGVRVESERSGRGPGVRITVSDHGPGVSSHDLPHIFEPFFRGAEAQARQAQGNGLGLALVRRIADTHGGRVTVSTAPGAGSAFSIHLPAAPSGSAGQAAA